MQFRSTLHLSGTLEGLAECFSSGLRDTGFSLSAFSTSLQPLKIATYDGHEIKEDL